MPVTDTIETETCKQPNNMGSGADGQGSEVGEAGFYVMWKLCQQNILNRGDKSRYALQPLFIPTAQYAEKAGTWTVH